MNGTFLSAMHMLRKVADECNKLRNGRVLYPAEDCDRLMMKVKFLIKYER